MVSKGRAGFSGPPLQLIPPVTIEEGEDAHDFIGTVGSHGEVGMEEVGGVVLYLVGFEVEFLEQVHHIVEEMLVAVGRFVFAGDLGG